MAEVTLHVYDITNSMNVRANSAIQGLNRFMRGGIGIGGIFHGAVEVWINFQSYRTEREYPVIWELVLIAFWIERRCIIRNGHLDTVRLGAVFSTVNRNGTLCTRTGRVYHWEGRRCRACGWKQLWKSWVKIGWVNRMIFWQGTVIISAMPFVSGLASREYHVNPLSLTVFALSCGKLWSMLIFHHLFCDSMGE